MRKKWFAFKAVAEDPSVAEVYVDDYIGNWIDQQFNQLFGEETCVTAKGFISQLAALPEAVKTIRVHVNSPGGDVFAALQIANALRDQRITKGRAVETIVDGLAASSASLIAMAGSPLRIADNGLLMIHNPYTGVVGDAEELRKAADAIDKIRDTIVATYQWHTPKSAKEIAALMAAETWMDADEAIANGFADEKGLKAAASIDPAAVEKLTVPDRFRDRVRALARVRNAKEEEMSPELAACMAACDACLKACAACISCCAALLSNPDCGDACKACQDACQKCLDTCAAAIAACSENDVSACEACRTECEACAKACAECAKACASLAESNDAAKACQDACAECETCCGDCMKACTEAIDAAGSAKGKQTKKPMQMRAPAMAPAALMEMCAAAGLDLPFARALAAEQLAPEAVQARVAGERDRRAAAQARETQIRTLCRVAGHEDLADDLVAGGMGVDQVRSHLTKLKAKLDRVEIDAGLPPDRGAAGKPVIDVAAVYRERNSPRKE